MSPSSLKPIETMYNGYRFRSRLEARWAVFFDTLGVRYEYEPEGYDLGAAGWYLPDFWLPDFDNFTGAWAEIKGTEPSDEERRKAEALAIQTRHPMYLFIGSIGVPSSGGEMSSELFGADGHWDCDHWWCECPGCGMLSVQFGGDSERIQCYCLREEKRKHGHTANAPRLVAAYARARQARFEHGERP